MTDENLEEIEVRVIRSPFNILPSEPLNVPEQDFNANNRAADIELSAGLNGGLQMNRICEVDQDAIKKMLIFSPYYYVNRYGRILKRSEVLGFALISLTVITIALLSQLGFEALGYFEPSKPNGLHPPRTFSWKILTEFYMSNSLSTADRDCLFSKKQFMFPGQEDQEIFPEQVQAELDRQSEEASGLEILRNGSTDSISLFTPHKQICKYARTGDGWAWLSKYMSSMFFSFLSVFCSVIFLSSIQCRRRKGLQFGLLVPSFICFFLDIFQQIPLTFHFNYANIVLMEDMHNALLSLALPPIIISPIWDDTQRHEHCCGIQSPDTWFIQGFDSYPRSCCNYTGHSCLIGNLPTREQVWSTGCYPKEYDRLRHFEGYALSLLFLKLVAEIGLFWTLSELTRHDYPQPEHLRTSVCHVKGYEVTTKGCVTTLGVTEQQVVAIKLRNFRPGKYLLLRNQNIAGQTITIRTSEKLVGAVEIRPPRQDRDRNNEDPIIDLEQGRNRGLVFVSF